MRYLLFLLFCLISCEDKPTEKVAEFPTHFETSEGSETATYLQVIDFYIQLAKEFPEINFQTVGETDSGQPLHIATYNPDSDFNFQKVSEDKTILLVNNGIHPGESDGIDATMMLFRDLAAGKLKAPVNTILVAIPIYNVGGALNRNSGTRANQNGPKSYGFRGNAKNYDLNRDFIKSDSKNAKTFAEIFHLVNPDIFIDNHVSNGADYQYTLTHLFTQHDKLGGNLGEYLNTKIRPSLEAALAKKNWDITPYVNVYNSVPEVGFSQFMDYPRYSTGYTTLWNTMGMMVETHMLKPYKSRVEGTYELLYQMMLIADIEGKKIKELRENAFKFSKGLTHYPTQWEIDSTRNSILNFKGYEADTLVSEVTGMPRLKYNRAKPFTKEVVYKDYMVPKDSVRIPEFYIVKKGYSKIMELMQLNNIAFAVLENDTLLNVETYHIEDYKTRTSPYEGHYLHYATKVRASKEQLGFTAGDWVIPVRQQGIRYILETLEPEATDSFFNWNFFDPILQQKEGFSPYVFEDEAAAMLKENMVLKDSFLSKKANDPKFSANWYAQLNWLYEKSDYYEKAHLRYPIYRILK